jgi:hypothetical protein
MLLERNIYVHGLRKVTVEGTSAALHSALTIHGSRSYHNSAQSLKLNYTQLGCREKHCVLLRFESTHFLSRYLSYISTDRHRLCVNPPNFIHSFTHTNAHISTHSSTHALFYAGSSLVTRRRHAYLGLQFNVTISPENCHSVLSSAFVCAFFMG